MITLTLYETKAAQDEVDRQAAEKRQAVRKKQEAVKLRSK